MERTPAIEAVNLTGGRLIREGKVRTVMYNSVLVSLIGSLLAYGMNACMNGVLRVSYIHTGLITVCCTRLEIFRNYKRATNSFHLAFHRRRPLFLEYRASSCKTHRDALLLLYINMNRFLLQSNFCCRLFPPSTRRCHTSIF